jgi:preprotein translocase SecE subunit
MDFEILKLVLWVLVIGGLFAWTWRKGYLRRLADYVGETRQELKKCTWPTLDELKGHTAVVIVAFVILSLFTVGVDVVVAFLVRQMI